MPSDSTIITFRPLLEQAVEEFISTQGWKTPGLSEATSELITALAKYREEGKRLFPVAYFTQDLPALLNELGGTDPLLIGRGPLNSQTMRRALKQCAPLGEGRSWVIYLCVNDNQTEFGVFRTTGSPIQPTSLERLRRIEKPSLPILGVVQLAENVIELRASAFSYRYIHLSGLSATGTPPTRTTRDFIEALTHDVSPEYRNPIANFYYRVVIDVMQVWHGTLAAVLPKGAPIPDFFRDGVILEEPVDIEERIRSVCQGGWNLNPGELQAESHLVRGMMGADGITLLSSDGKILGYNVFMNSPIQATVHSSEGGARWRTYRALCKMVGQDLVATFYRSQDGSSNCMSQFAVSSDETRE